MRKKRKIVYYLKWDYLNNQEILSFCHSEWYYNLNATTQIVVAII